MGNSQETEVIYNISLFPLPTQREIISEVIIKILA